MLTQSIKISEVALSMYEISSYKTAITLNLNNNTNYYTQNLEPSISFSINTPEVNPVPHYPLSLTIEELLTYLRSMIETDSKTNTSNKNTIINSKETAQTYQNYTPYSDNDNFIFKQSEIKIETTAENEKPIAKILNQF